MNLKIALLAGDGIGREIIDQAVKVSDAVAEKFGHNITWTPALTGAAAIDAVGEPYPEETHEVCTNADAVFLSRRYGTSTPAVKYYLSRLHFTAHDHQAYKRECKKKKLLCMCRIK